MNKTIKKLLNQDLEEYRESLMKDSKNELSSFSVIIFGIILLASAYYFWVGFWIVNQQIVVSVILVLLGMIVLYSGLFGKNISELSQEQLKKSMNVRNKLLKIMNILGKKKK